MWVQLGPVACSEQAGARSALVISPDVMDEHSPVILIAPLTTKKTERVYPFEAMIEPPDGATFSTTHFWASSTG